MSEAKGTGNPLSYIFGLWKKSEQKKKQIETSDKLDPKEEAKKVERIIRLLPIFIREELAQFNGLPSTISEVKRVIPLASIPTPTSTSTSNPTSTPIAIPTSPKKLAVITWSSDKTTSDSSSVLAEGKKKTSEPLPKLKEEKLHEKELKDPKNSYSLISKDLVIVEDLAPFKEMLMDPMQLYKMRIQCLDIHSFGFRKIAWLNFEGKAQILKIFLLIPRHGADIDSEQWEKTTENEFAQEVTNLCVANVITKSKGMVPPKKIGWRRVSAGMEYIIVMDADSHQTLGSLLKKANDSELTWKRRLQYAQDIASTLAKLHVYMVHGDIKSSNIVIDSHHGARLIDFGSSKIIHNKTDEIPIGSISAGWMPPEMSQYGPGDRMLPSQYPPAEVYSFGMLLAEIITRLEIEKLQDVNSIKMPKGCPPKLFELMKKCCQKDPLKRPTMAQVAEKLKSINPIREEQPAPSQSYLMPGALSDLVKEEKKQEERASNSLLSAEEESLRKLLPKGHTSVLDYLSSNPLANLIKRGRLSDVENLLLVLETPKPSKKLLSLYRKMLNNPLGNTPFDIAAGMAVKSKNIKALKLLLRYGFECIEDTDKVRTAILKHGIKFEEFCNDDVLSHPSPVFGNPSSVLDILAMASPKPTSTKETKRSCVLLKSRYLKMVQPDDPPSSDKDPHNFFYINLEMFYCIFNTLQPKKDDSKREQASKKQLSICLNKAGIQYVRGFIGSHWDFGKRGYVILMKNSAAQKLDSQVYAPYRAKLTALSYLEREISDARDGRRQWGTLMGELLDDDKNTNSQWFEQITHKLNEYCTCTTIEETLEEFDNYLVTLEKSYQKEFSRKEAEYYQHALKVFREIVAKELEKRELSEPVRIRTGKSGP